MDPRQRIKEEFTYYLSNIARSSRRTDKGFNLQPTAVQSFLAFLEVDRLFDYNPEIWKHIKSMYDITVPNEVENIVDTLLNDEEFTKHDNDKNQGWRSGSIIHYVCFIKARSYFMNEKTKDFSETPDQKTIDKIPSGVQHSTYRPYITAIKSKPFLLLAGISGTGKSRIVRELARACREEGTDEYKAQKPKNFQMVQVKPNWHDSSDLIGYVSRVSGKAEFVAGEFLKFVAKAWEDTETPYFLCLDEMNLAPVEQYFAEYLSVIESRKSHEDGTVTTDPILEKTDEEWYFNLTASLTSDEDIRKQFNEEGICIPQNLIVVGTVNMDETTHQFSRKVIDRAMTIEMNIEDTETPFKNFFEGGDDLHYYDNPQPKDLFLPKVVQASEALSILSAEDASYLKENVPGLLHSLNSALNGTPFKIAYRVQNELILYFFSLREENPDEAAEALLAQAMDAILIMKVLPRIEGDEDLLDKPLKALAQFTENYPQASRKIAEMQERLPQAHFTCFWP